MTIRGVFTDWKMIGAITGLLSLGASGMAATVNSKLTHTAEQNDDILSELRAIKHIEAQQLCISIGIESKLACLQK